jgi:hypothetical protein
MFHVNDQQQNAIKITLKRLQYDAWKQTLSNMCFF